MNQKFIQKGGGARAPYKIAFAIAASLAVGDLINSLPTKLNETRTQTRFAFEDAKKQKLQNDLELETRRDACQIEFNRDLCLASVASRPIDKTYNYHNAKFSLFVAEVAYLLFQTTQKLILAVSSVCGSYIGFMWVVLGFAEKKETLQSAGETS